MKIYLVATFRDYNSNDGIKGSRTVGYFETLDDARKCIEENWGDIYEDEYYKYAVIEDVEPGLYMSTDSNPTFFKWIDKGYKEIPKPEGLEHYFGFTIG